MIWFLAGLFLGVLFGAVAKHAELRAIYIKRLERVVNLAELMQETRGRQNRELAQLRLAMEQFGQAVATLKGWKKPIPKDVH